MSLRKEDNFVVSTRKDCSQLFFIFTGAFQNVLGMSPLDFLQKTGLANRNFVILKDPHRVAFRRGISDEIRDLPSLLEWQKNLVSELSHVQQVYCVGVSAGGIPAIVSGHHLDAETVWSFSARPPQASWAGEYDAARIARNRLRDAFNTYTRRAAYRLRRLTRTPAKSPYDTRLVDMDLVEETAVRLKETNGKTEYRLYYVPSNSTDAHIQNILMQCPGTVSLPVEPPADYEHMYYPGWDHMVLAVLNAKGDLKDLFPPSARA